LRYLKHKEDWDDLLSLYVLNYLYRAEKRHFRGTFEGSNVLLIKDNVVVGRLHKNICLRLGEKYTNILNKPLIRIRDEILSPLGNGNGRCNQCTLFNCLKSLEASLRSMMLRHRGKGECDRCVDDVVTFIYNSMDLIMDCILFKMCISINSRAVEDLFLTSEEAKVDSLVLATLIGYKLRQKEKHDFNIYAEVFLDDFNLRLGSEVLSLGVVDVLLMLDNQIIQVEVTTSPLRREKGWSHSANFYYRHFLLKSISVRMRRRPRVKTYVIVPYIGDMPRIEPGKGIKKEFSIVLIELTGDLKNDFEHARDKLLREFIDELTSS